MRLLRNWLILAGVVQCAAVIAVFVPHTRMDACGRWMGVDSLPSGSLPGYLARLSSAMYVIHGAMLIITACNLPLVLPIVVPFARLTIALGGVMLWIDVTEGMPIGWTLFESIALASSGGVTEYFARRTKTTLLRGTEPVTIV
ncbi:MAG: hypothetical protein FJ308_04750 [Planctomycetes bacterium]|nr:hypothetical protein [Planctomycetota bacterium]